MRLRTIAVLFLCCFLFAGTTILFSKSTKYKNLLSYVDVKSSVVVHFAPKNKKASSFYKKFYKKYFDLTLTKKNKTTNTDIEIIAQFVQKATKDIEFKEGYVFYVPNVRPILRFNIEDPKHALNVLASNKRLIEARVAKNKYFYATFKSFDLLFIVQDATLVVTIDSPMLFSDRLENVFTVPKRHIGKLDLQRGTNANSFILLDTPKMAQNILELPIVQIMLDRGCKDSLAKLTKNIFPKITYSITQKVNKKGSVAKVKGNYYVSFKDRKIIDSFSKKGRAFATKNPSYSSISSTINHEILGGISKMVNVYLGNSCKKILKGVRLERLKDYGFLEGFSFIAKDVFIDKSTSFVLKIHSNNFSKLLTASKGYLQKNDINSSKLLHSEQKSKDGLIFAKRQNDLVVSKNHKNKKLEQIHSLFEARNLNFSKNSSFILPFVSHYNVLFKTHKRYIRAKESFTIDLSKK